ncbi:uncharacterized protein LOC110757963 isoform X2 [Prunus avium]|uniref:Uncharacterized protein LOC110757963 isoform X2 n=1 Tax=Prunus avium TaxID=42229 RepID=A0A6P5SP54_PRUAV|nr:uncharacterized protein LOC110757963 isoform X2 [Prunus avium]XP_021815415.1 uncharacterized protein LOC110757963 isoform X2 [Prunus avium]
MAKNDHQASPKKPAHHRILRLWDFFLFSENFWLRRIIKLLRKSQPITENLWPRKILKLLRKSQLITEFLAKKDHQASPKKPAHHRLWSFFFFRRISGQEGSSSFSEKASPSQNFWPRRIIKLL